MQWLRLILSSALLLGAFGLVREYSYGEAVPITRPLSAFPAQLGSWQGRESTVLSDSILEELRPSDYLMRRYEDEAGRSLWLYVGYWETQRKGAQIHSPKNCLPGGGWEPLEVRVVSVPVDGTGPPIDVNRYLLQHGSEQLLVAYWYLAQGEPVATEIGAKIALVRNSILEHRSDGAIVRVSSPVYGTVSDTWAWLVDYIRVMYPKLHGYLP